MDDSSVANDNIGADHCWHTVVNVYNAPILNIRARADPDARHIATQHGTMPHTHLLSKVNRTRHNGT
jgi:hypothetical protein